MFLTKVLRAVDTDIRLKEIFVGIVISCSGSHSLIAVCHIVTDFPVREVARNHSCHVVFTECTVIVNLCLEIHSGICRTCSIAIVDGIVNGKVGYSRGICSWITDLHRIRIDAKTVNRVKCGISSELLIVCNLAGTWTVDDMSLVDVVWKHCFDFQALSKIIHFVPDGEVCLEIYIMSLLVTHISDFSENILGIEAVTEKKSSRMV